MVLPVMMANGAALADTGASNYSKQTATALFLDDISYISENAQADEPEIKG